MSGFSVAELNLTAYVAGASSEAQRCASFAAQLEARGITITHRWWDDVAAAGSANRGLTQQQRRAAALSCLRGVGEAMLVYVLAPREGAATIGAWVELGFALRSVAAGSEAAILFVGDRESTVFAELCHGSFANESEALAKVDASIAKVNASIAKVNAEFANELASESGR